MKQIELIQCNTLATELVAWTNTPLTAIMINISAAAHKHGFLYKAAISEVLRILVFEKI